MNGKRKDKRSNLANINEKNTITVSSTIYINDRNGFKILDNKVKYFSGRWFFQIQ